MDYDDISYDGHDEDYYGDDFYDDEPDLDFMFEHDSTMASCGWGTDEDYGYYGDDGW